MTSRDDHLYGLFGCKDDTVYLFIHLRLREMRFNNSNSWPGPDFGQKVTLILTFRVNRDHFYGVSLTQLLTGFIFALIDVIRFLIVSNKVLQFGFHFRRRTIRDERPRI